MKTLSFVIPCYNEEKRLTKTFRALDSVKLPRGLKLSEVIFVNDGSNDSTLKLLNSFAGYSDIPVKVVSYAKNMGKGYAIKVGMLESSSEYTLFFDADMSTPLAEIEKIAPNIKKGAQVIIGTRKNGHSTVIKHQPLYRELLGKVFTRITQFALQTQITDFTCGFKCFSKNATKKIFTKALINGWGYDAEIIFLAEKYGFRPQEVAVTWSNDDRSRVRIFSAILNTFKELAIIRWEHSIKSIFYLPKITYYPIVARFFRN